MISLCFFEISAIAEAARPDRKMSPLENFSVMPAEVLVARVELFVHWQPYRLGHRGR
jgi:hypothetical protein